MKNYLYLTLFILYLSCQSENSISNKTAANDSLTTQLQQVYNNGNLPGFSITITDEDEAIYQKAFGYADVESNKAYTVNTTQPVASISKTLVGLSLLKAQELGKLNLDDPINNYLPYPLTNPKHLGVDITIRHLANHTSSIIDTDFYDACSYVFKNNDYLTASSPVKGIEYFNSPKEAAPIQGFMKNILYTEEGKCCREVFSDEEPGTSYVYSNGGTTLAAVILEIATQTPYKQFVNEHTLQPLKMKQSSWNDEDFDATLYHHEDTINADYFTQDYPAGGFVTNAEDLILLTRELINGYSGSGTLLSSESYSELYDKNFVEVFSNEPFPDEEIPFLQVRYDKGIYMGLAPNGYIGHTGADPGTVSFMFFNKDSNKGFVFITNRLIWWEFEDALNDLMSNLNIMKEQTS